MHTPIRLHHLYLVRNYFIVVSLQSDYKTKDISLDDKFICKLLIVRCKVPVFNWSKAYFFGQLAELRIVLSHKRPSNYVSLGAEKASLTRELAGVGVGLSAAEERNGLHII